MNAENPIYTEKTECQDCYKCVRNCPVKAILVRDGSAAVIAEDCLYCGKCTLVCPVGAKKVRDDIDVARKLIASGKKVYASLAPSFRSEFADIPEGQLLACIKQLGFEGVSETALGAQEVSAACARILSEGEKRVYVSTACPSVVRLIERFYPDYIGNLTDLMSPVQAHGRILRDLYGDDIGIVFFSPCIAKKTETGETIDVSLTFKELRRWLNSESIVVSDETAAFVPEKAEEGGWYPIDGGMIDGIRQNRQLSDVQFLCVSGVKNIMESLEDINKLNLDAPVFIEALACEGGCVNGPQVSKRGATVVKRSQILKTTPLPSEDEARNSIHDIERFFHPEPPKKKKYLPEQIAQALRWIGKIRHSDELNCGGCGYNTCQDFAIAMLEDRAEPAMCVSHLRRLAQNKANALLKSMPSGVVIVDKDLKILECNPRFVEIIGGDAGIVFEVNPELAGVYLERLVPFHEVFKHVLEDGSDSRVMDIEHDKKVIRLTVFTVEPHHTVGGVLQDVTEPVIQSEKIIQNAREVMKKNLTTVQQIAFLLGENAADSEVLLNSIIQSFSRKGQE